MVDRKYDLEDNDDTVSISLQTSAHEDEITVDSKTTSLSVKEAGKLVLQIFELFGTVDASSTKWSLSGGVLKITLQKLGKEPWTQLEAPEVKSTIILH